MKTLPYFLSIVFTVPLAGCSDTATQTGPPASDASYENAVNTPGVSFIMTTQTYDAAAGSYGDSNLQKSTSADQVESAIQSMNWSTGPIRPMIKLVRMDADDITAYLNIRKDPGSGESIEASWQNVSDNNQFVRTTILNNKDAVLKVAIAFLNDDDLTPIAEWTDQ